MNFTKSRSYVITVIHMGEDKKTNLDHKKCNLNTKHNLGT